MRRRRETLGMLYALYHETNQLRFGLLLPTVPIYINPIKRRKKDAEGAEYAHTWQDDFTGAPRNIEIAEDHALLAPWADVRETLLHELIHVWQCATGWPMAHDSRFRAMAKRLGCSGRATD